MKNRKASNILYGFGAGVFLVHCVWSVVGISPFVRIGLFILTAVFLHFASRLRAGNTDMQISQQIMKNTYLLMFLLYLLLFFALVFVDGYYEKDIRSGGFGVESFEDYVENFVNLVPFKNTQGLLYGYKMHWISAKMPLLNIGGNLLLCMPFAFFLPLFFKKQHNFFLFFLTIAGISCFVEGMQFVTRRGFCDVDDLIFNVAGACVLFGLLHIPLIKRLIEKITKLQY